MCFTKPKTSLGQDIDHVSARPSRRVPKTGFGSSSNNTDQSSSTQISKDSRSSDNSSRLSSVKEILADNPNIYSFAEISNSTHNFRLGKIGPSSVWKAILRGKDVAIMDRVAAVPIDVLPVDLPSKLRELCSLHHRNVIDLLGSCIEGKHVYLVYRFVEGMNLKDCLRGRGELKAFTVLGTWISRVRIALDVAQALEYLHHHSGVDGYIHKHLKSSSIMVVEPGLRALIGHFGASELCGERSINNQIRGVPGYMAPELSNYGSISQKTDVFAFGVVMLELLSGKEPVSYDHDKASNGYRRASIVKDFLGFISQPDSTVRLRTWIDYRLNDSYPVDSVERFAVLASQCLDSDPIKRPDMRAATAQLSGMHMEAQKWAATFADSRQGMSTAFEGR